MSPQVFNASWFIKIILGSFWVGWILISVIADPEPAFYLKAYPDPRL